MALSILDNEELCTRCGICCYVTIPDHKGVRFFTPFHCQFLDLKTKSCTRYSDRKRAFSACSTAGQAAAISILPLGCPYTLKIPGYVGPETDYQDSAYVTQVVKQALAKGPDKHGLYTLFDLKFKLDESCSPLTFVYSG